MPQKNTASYALPALVYVLLIGVTFLPDVQPVLVKAFGSTPLGFPVPLVVAVAQAILLLPFAFALHHFMRIAGQAAREGHGAGIVDLLVFATSAGQRHPELRRSQIFSLAGLVYFVVLCAAWIVYADIKGI